MARNCSVAERNIINAAGVNHLLFISVEDADGVMQDVTLLGDLNLDFMDGASWSEGLDQPVSTGSLVIRRDTTEDSAAPTIGASSINRNALGGYAPLFEKGRAILISTATVTQGSDPVIGDKKPMFTGRIDGVHWQDNPMTVDISDIGAWLADAVLVESKVYASDSTEPGGGPLLGEVIQNMINDAIPDDGEAVDLYEPVTAPFQPYSKDAQEPGNLFPAIRRWAQEIGWELRYRWDNADQFRLTLFEPPRSKGTPDWTIGPSEYRNVTTLTSNISDIRNEIIVQYKDTNGKLKTVTAKDQTSIDKYGGPSKISRIWQFPSATIRTEEDAQQLADAVLSDLSEADADQEIEMPYFWPVQIGDLILFLANGDHYDSDQLLAVVSYQHSFINGSGSTTLQCRGKVAGAFRTWVRWVNDTDGGLQPDTRALALKNFREIRRTPTVVTFGWNAVDDDVAEIWGWQKYSPQDVDPPLSPDDEEDRLWCDIKNQKPNVMLDNTTVTFDVAVPDFGFVQTWELQPIGEDLARGYSQRVKVLAAPDIPRITSIETSEGASGLFKDITALNVVDPQARGGTLKVWLNHDFPEDANPEGAPDGTLAIALTPYAVLVTDVFTLTSGGTAQLFDNVRIHPGAGKRIYFEFINSKGTSSGKIQFILLSSGGIIDEQGNLLDGSINRAQQVAASMTLPSVYDTLPATGRANELAFLTSDNKLYRWKGTGWTAEVPAPDLTGLLTKTQLQDHIIDLLKIDTSDIAPPEILSVLPSSPGPNRVALVGSTLWRSTPDGAGWTNTAGAIAASDITGQLVTAQIAVGNITNALIAANAVDTAKLANNAVTNAILAANAVQTVNVALGAITNALIAAGAVTTTTISDNAISTPKIIAGAITSTSLATDSVIASKIAAGAVVAGKIDVGAVTADTIGANAVTSDKIIANAITSAKISAGAVLAASIGAGEITTIHMNFGSIAGDRIAVNTLNGNRIVALSIDSSLIAASAIIAGKIGAAAVNTNELAANAVVASKIGANEVTTIHMQANTINGDRITAGTFHGSKVIAATISATELAADSVTAGKIQASAVTTTALQAGAVTSVKLSTIVLAETGPGVGIIQIGKLTAVVGTTWLDLNATGSLPILHSPSLDLRADGTATFSGALSAASGTFVGTVGSSLFTSINLNLTASDSVILFNNPSTQGSGMIWGTSSVGALTFVLATTGVGPSPYAQLILQGDGSVRIFSNHEKIDIRSGGGQGVWIEGIGPISLGAANSGGSGKRLMLMPN